MTPAKPHPLVIQSIEDEPVIADGCNCYPFQTKWHLCPYHQGMQDGIEAFQRVAVEMYELSQERAKQRAAAIQALRDPHNPEER